MSKSDEDETVIVVFSGGSAVAVAGEVLIYGDPIPPTKDTKPGWRGHHDCNLAGCKKGKQARGTRGHLMARIVAPGQDVIDAALARLQADYDAQVAKLKVQEAEALELAKKLTAAGQGPGFSMCAWCGVKTETSDEETKLSHMRSCEKSPLVMELAAARAALGVASLAIGKLKESPIEPLRQWATSVSKLLRTAEDGGEVRDAQIPNLRGGA